MSVNEMKKLPEFSGPFKDIITRYIEYRKAQGIKISAPFVYHLRRMDLFFKDMGLPSLKSPARCMMNVQRSYRRKRKRTRKNVSQHSGTLLNTLCPWAMS